jgi:hypothetical protein
MSSALENLTRKINRLELEVATIRMQLDEFIKDSTESSDLERKQAALMARLRKNKPLHRKIFASFLDDLGIQGEPVSAEELQKRIAAGGVKQEDNEFSREVIKMREE